MERWRSCGSTVCSIGAFTVTLQRQGSAKSPASKGFNSGTGSVAASGAVGTGDADGMAGAGGSFAAAGAFGTGVDLRSFALAFLGGALMLGAGVTSDATGVSSTGASGTGAGPGEGAGLEKTRSWVGVGMGAREKCSSKRFTRSPFEPSWSSGHSRVPVS